MPNCNCDLTLQILMNVPLWTEAVKPTVPTPRAATSAAVARATLSCLTSGPAQVIKHRRCHNVTSCLVVFPWKHKLPGVLHGVATYSTQMYSCCFYQISMSVRRLQTSVMEASVPTFPGNTAVCVTMASWLLWTWGRVSVRGKTILKI